MSYVIFLLVLILLFAGFLALTVYENRSGRRYFAGTRHGFDRRVARIEFIVTHVDFAAFVRDTAKQVAEQAAHDIAHVVLLAVRWAERQLTRAVRSLRARRAETAGTATPNPALSADAEAAQGAGSTPTSTSTSAQASEFARGMTDFKQELRAHRDDAVE